MRFHVTHNKWWYLLIIILSLAGCATARKNFMSSSVPMIQLDRTTEEEIREWFGKPYSEGKRSSSYFSKTKILDYQYAMETDTTVMVRMLTVEIKNGLVYSYLFHSSLPEDDTDFDTELRNQLETGKTTKEDAKGILGPPCGKIKVPTNIIREELSNAGPEGTKDIWCYFHVISRGAKGTIFKIHVKQLILYFDGKGVLVHMYFNEKDALPNNHKQLTVLNC